MRSPRGTITKEVVMKERRGRRKSGTQGINAATIAVVLLAVLLSLAAVSAVQAATFTVNSTIDAVDASPGNGKCATSTALRGVCTLRAAIMEANALAGGPHTIVLPAGTYELTLLGAGENNAATGDLDIKRSVNVTAQNSPV